MLTSSPSRTYRGAIQTVIARDFVGRLARWTFGMNDGTRIKRQFTRSDETCKDSASAAIDAKLTKEYLVALAEETEEGQRTSILKRSIR
jgi:hypothetical protein